MNITANNDLELSKKIRGTVKWQRVPLPQGQAAVNLNSSKSKAGASSYTPEKSDDWSLSPAPGRPDQDRAGKRGRDSTGSQSGQSNPKSARPGSGEDDEVTEEDKIKEREEAWKESIEGADLVGESTISPTKDDTGLSKKPDQGFGTSITGTPAKVDDLRKSPILSKTNRNKY